MSGVASAGGSSARRCGRIWATAAVALLLAALPAAAQDYPTHPITLIVPFPAGGGVDAVARIVAQKLSVALGQQVVIDNRGGAGGVIGTRAAVKAAPDGYTLVMAHTGTTSINPTLYANPGYDPRKDFTPIGLISSTPIVIMTHPSFPAKTLGEMIALAKTSPGTLNVGTPPMGTGGYLAAELLKATAGVDVTVVLYKGTAPLTNDLLGNQVPVGFNVMAPAMGNLQAGNLRAMAVLGPTRSSLLPDVPTAAESGLPGFEAMLHYGLLAPAGTPKPIVARLNAELRKLLNSPDVKERIFADGGDPYESTPEEYAADIDREEAKWSALIKKLGLRVE
ncbi:MAG TPA: tripartite tricarboxylate transporter substrate binding protein [Xanthobacteraceae bacterium]|jgi:tripartite-type tricarboxylate transporter receptor subunit TctC|nr:tripartite tricarboxylate transporter substrate binding protein [Xanthobacteraceae bacterium]